MIDVLEYLPKKVNSGPWLTAYTLPELERRIGEASLVLPICSLGTPLDELECLGDFVLPPLYHEALNPSLKSAILTRIDECFPYYVGTAKHRENTNQLQIVELPKKSYQPTCQPRVLSFSVDTAVEEHGPHLPLATDTIQSYAVLRALRDRYEGFQIGPPVEYGHLTWGLPFGLSIDITPELLTQYVAGYCNAVLEWCSPEALYVVDVHGSVVHRESILNGLKQSRCDRWSFRWLHEPLVEFAGNRGDQHAGGVETALVEYISSSLVDAAIWPNGVEELQAGQLSFELACELTSDLPRFIAEVESERFNGIVGKIENYFDLDASLLMDRMVSLASADVEGLLSGEEQATPDHLPDLAD